MVLALGFSNSTADLRTCWKNLKSKLQVQTESALLHTARVSVVFIDSEAPRAWVASRDLALNVCYAGGVGGRAEIVATDV